MSDPTLKITYLKGCWGVPIGFRYMGLEVGQKVNTLLISTVYLDEGHLRDPLGIIAPESGYETAVFLNGSSLTICYRQNYETRTEALRGHRTVVRKLMNNKLPLSIEIYGYAWEEIDETESQLLRTRKAPWQRKASAA